MAAALSPDVFGQSSRSRVTVSTSPGQANLRSRLSNELRQSSASAEEPPRTQGQGAERDQAEHAHPQRPRNPGKPGELVGVVRGAGAPPPALLQFQYRPRPAEQQEPGHRVAERGLDEHRALPQNRL